jgi:2-polyprenyl-3-methyl-5-hydroxy-6-metoxy-1,4-benzoquinol methylase
MYIKEKQYEYLYGSNQLANAHGYLMKPLLHMLPKPQRKSQKLKVLDLGCGNGSLSSVIAQEGYEVIGMEESPSGIEIARRNFPSCQFIQGSIYDASSELLNHSFDIVMSIEVIEHLFHPRELPRLAKKCLKPGGS